VGIEGALKVQVNGSLASIAFVPIFDRRVVAAGVFVFADPLTKEVRCFHDHRFMKRLQNSSAEGLHPAFNSFLGAEICVTPTVWAMVPQRAALPHCGAASSNQYASDSMELLRRHTDYHMLPLGNSIPQKFKAS
jgi:hypothetical protein